EQMKGRGVRVISPADFQTVTPDATSKDRFVLVDAVGVTETDLVDSPPLDREPTVPLERLMNRIASRIPDPTTVSTVESRIARPDRTLTSDERMELEELAGITLSDLTRGMVEAVDPDRQLDAARAATGKDEPDASEIAAATKQLLRAAVEPLAT